MILYTRSKTLQNSSNGTTTFSKKIKWEIIYNPRRKTTNPLLKYFILNSISLNRIIQRSMGEKTKSINWKDTTPQTGIERSPKRMSRKTLLTIEQFPKAILGNSSQQGRIWEAIKWCNMRINSLGNPPQRKKYFFI